MASSTADRPAGRDEASRCGRPDPSGRTLDRVSAKGITDELVQQVADELRARYGRDDEDLRARGSRRADCAAARSEENIEFAKRFTDEHRETFDRLAE